MATKKDQSIKSSKTDNICDTITKLIQDCDANAAPIIDIVEDTSVTNDINLNSNSDKINDDELDDLVEEQQILNKIQEMENRRLSLRINKVHLKNTDALSSANSFNHNSQDQINDDDDSLFNFMANSGIENNEQRYKDDLDKLSKALTLNIVMQSELNKLETYLVAKLKQNQIKQSETNNEIRRLQQREDKTICEKPKSWYAKFGIPYFKDIRRFSCDSNLDVRKMKSFGQMLSINVNFSKIWRYKEKVLLENAVKKLLVEENTAELLEQKKTIKNDLQDCRDKKIEKVLKQELSSLNVKIVAVKKKSLLNLLSNCSPDKEFDWFTISADHVHTHSASECQRMWHLYVKPSINKTKWAVKEDNKLLELVGKYKKQNWDMIAKELGTSRSPYQCFVNYQTRLNKEAKKFGKWTPEEDEALAALIARCRVGYYIPWTKVAYYFQGRTLPQIYCRWNTSLNPNLKKGRFSRLEDKMIVSYVRKFGDDFCKISKLIGDRTSVQLRERYARAIPEKYRNIGRWSLEEDKLLVSLVKKYGVSKWSSISKQFVTRTRTQVRQRYSVIKNLLGKNPDIELESIYRGPKAMSQSTLPTVPFVKETEQNKENKSLKELIDQSQMEETLMKRRNNTLTTRIKAGRKKIFRRKHVDTMLLNYFKETYTNDKLKLKTQYLKPDVDKAVNAMAVFCKFLQTHIKLPSKESNEYKKLPVTLRNIALKMQERCTDWGCNCLGSSASCDSYFCFCQNENSIDCTPVDLETTLVDDCDYLLNPLFDLKKPNKSNARKCKCSTDKVKHFLPFYLPPNIITSIGFRSVLLIKEKIAVSLAFDRKRTGYFSQDNLEFQKDGFKTFTGYFSDDEDSSSDDVTIINNRGLIDPVNASRGSSSKFNSSFSPVSISIPSTSSNSASSFLLTNNTDLRSPNQETTVRLKEQDAIYLWKERLIAILGWPIVLANQPTNFSPEFKNREENVKLDEPGDDNLMQQKDLPSVVECLPEKTNRIVNGSTRGVKRKIEDTKKKCSIDKPVEALYELFEDCGNLENDIFDKRSKVFSNESSNCNTLETDKDQSKPLILDDVLPIEKVSCKKSYTRLKQKESSGNYGLSSSFISLNKVYKCYTRKKGSTENKTD